MSRVLDVLNPFHKAGGYAVPHAIVAMLLGAVLALSGVLAVHHLVPQNSGYNHREEKLPPAVRIGGGGVPRSVDLSRYLTRIHQQGASSSCVGQTLSTVTEILRNEGGHRDQYSAGFIWNLSNGGVDQGITYESAFGTLQSAGDAPLSAFWPDGYDGLGVYPDQAAYAAAYPNRISSWATIAVSDRASIEQALAHGLPLAYAAPWDDSWVNHYSSSWLPWPSGSFYWWHSVTLVGYDQNGVWIQNSLNGWGDAHQRALLPWTILENTQGSIVVAYPVYPYHRPKPKPFDARLWSSARTLHHQTLISPYYHGKLSQVARSWWQQQHGRPGGIIGPESWDSKRRVMATTFWWARAWSWPTHHGWPVRWQYSRKPLR